MQVRLELTHDKANVKRVVLSSDAVLGRSTSCNLRIASSLVSRRHCKISLTDAGVLVRDLESSNGTFLDGERLTPNEDVFVAPGSRLSLGGIEFIVQYEVPQSAGFTPPGSTVDLPMAGGDSSDDLEAGDGPLAAELDVPADDGAQSLGIDPHAHQAEPEADTRFPQRALGVSAAEGPPPEAPQLQEPTLADPAAASTADRTSPDVAPLAPPRGGEDTSEPPAAAGRSSEAALEVEVEDDPDAETDEEPAPASRGGLRSVFGMFGRKRPAPPMDAPHQPEDDESESDASAEDTQGPADQTLDEAPAERFPEAPAADAAEDEAAAFLFEADSGRDEPDDDLGDFLRKLDQK